MTNETLPPALHFYQSANVDAAIIKDNFVVRTHEYDVIINDIRNNPMNGSVQHYLLLGRRGSGKSTLLKRIQTEIDTDEALQQKYIAVNLAEEQANIYRLYDLLEEIVQELEYSHVEVQKPSWEPDENSFSRKLFDAIHTAIEQSDKKVVLLLDNIDRIFENLKKNAGLLREMLLNYIDIIIIGGSTRMTEHFWKYNQPFYQFFRVLELQPLTSDEMKRLFLHWSEKLNLPILKNFVEKQPGRLQTVRILTDGLPRTLQFFLNILIKRTHETGYEYLRLIMDQVTPLYQERLNNLPPSQRKIVLQMAFIWESAGAKEIAEASRMDNKLISAQLKQLIEKGIAEKIETSTKNHLYRLSERFFNLWLIFTQGNPAEKRKAKCLTIFLENFYDEKDLQNQVMTHLEELSGNKLSPNSAALLSKAYAQSKFISVAMRNELIQKTLQLSGIDESLKRQLPATSNEVYEEAIRLGENGKWSEFHKKIDLIEQEDGFKDLLLGISYEGQGKYELAEKFFKLALDKGETSATTHLGICYEMKKDIDEAEKFYLIRHKTDSYASYRLGDLYYTKLQFDTAENFYLLAIENLNQQPITPPSSLAKLINNSFFQLGHIYETQNKFELAEKYFLLAKEKGSNAALGRLGVLYQNQQKNDLAEQYYLLAIDKGVDGAKIFLASFYYLLNRNKERALSLIEQLEHFTPDDELRKGLLIAIRLWNGLIEEALTELTIMLSNNELKYLKDTLGEVLIHHQTNAVRQLFENPNFREKLMDNFLPVYYVVNTILRTKETDLRIPPELRETVDEILKEVKEGQIHLYGSSQIK